PRSLELGEERSLVADDAELGEADDLLRREGAAAAVLLEPAMRDELDDVAGRVEEVDRLCVPALEVEDAAGELEALLRPGARRVEAVAGNEEREVVERLAVLAAEAELRLAGRPVVQGLQLGDAVAWSGEGDLHESHEAQVSVRSWTRSRAPSWRSSSRSRASAPTRRIARTSSAPASGLPSSSARSAAERPSSLRGARGSSCSARFAPRATRRALRPSSSTTTSTSSRRRRSISGRANRSS